MLLLAYGWHSTSTTMVGIVLSSAHHACNAMPSTCYLGQVLKGSRGSVTYAHPYRPSLTMLTQLHMTTAFLHMPRGIPFKLCFLCTLLCLLHEGVGGLLLLCVGWKHPQLVHKHSAYTGQLPGGPNLLARFARKSGLALVSGSGWQQHNSHTLL